MSQDLSLTLDDVPVTPQVGAGVAGLTERLQAVTRKASGTYESHEEALRLPADPSILSEVTHLVQKYWTNQLKYVVVIGIGGSNLGAKAVVEALQGTMGAHLGHAPQLLFADTVSPRLLLDLEQIMLQKVAYAEEVVINLVSKSGATTESIANFDILYASLAKRFPDLLARVVVTTDHGSKLWSLAEEHGVGLLPLPKEIGGRWSVFSTVGLFPLMLAGVSAEELLAGARSVTESALARENAPLRYATALYRAHKGGATMVNFFFFNPEFESLGKWARQLYAESLGKEKDRSGKVVHAGITPIVSIGSTDLHSMAQLYLGGPRDKFTLFTYVPERTKLQVSTDGMFLPLVSGLAGKSPEELMGAIYDGVRAAYATHQLPRGEMRLSAISPYAIGQFLQFHMIAVVYLAEMLHVDPFDQPNVEDYKKVTREILERQQKQ